MPHVVAAGGLEAPTSAYVHIPFCRRRCFYCDFPISVLGEKRGETSGSVEEYVGWLCAEIAATPAGGEPLQTVFFGGGTPSLLSVAQLAQVLDALEHRFGLGAGAEISMEMDPGTFSREHLRGYRQWGVNRVSLGVQGFEDEQLAACGRIHRRAEVMEAVDWLQGEPLGSWSLDLISGLPHQTLESWERGLEVAIATQAPHLSLYDLTVEPGTVFARRYQPGEAPLPADEHTAAMYRLSQGRLTACGYDHYEVSNYAQPGHQCRHNRTYWENRPYYGFGMGATSYVHGQRFGRPRTRREYRQWLREFVATGTVNAPATPPDEALLDRLMVGLRLAEGVDLSDISEGVWQQLQRCLAPYRQRGWVVQQQRRLRLSDPEGFLFSNQVLVALFNGLGTPSQA